MGSLKIEYSVGRKLFGTEEQGEDVVFGFLCSGPFPSQHTDPGWNSYKAQQFLTISTLISEACAAQVENLRISSLAKDPSSLEYRYFSVGLRRRHALSVDC